VDAYELTGLLARSATALLYTAGGGPFHGEGVLKLTGTAYAPILHRELELLNRCADARIGGVVAPVSRDLALLRVGNADADRLALAIALPWLTGGDLLVVVDRAARGGRLGPQLALALARPLATVLRHLLEDLPTPLAHGDLRPRNVLLPRVGAPLADVVLIDFDSAREIGDDRSPLADDVRAFGELLLLLSSGQVDTGPTPAARTPFDTLVRRCWSATAGAAARDGYTSLADAHFWADLQTAEAAAPS
jgi:serine/threonine protein kinase